MRNVALIVLSILFASPFTLAAEQVLNGREIAERMQAADNSRDSQRNGTMVIQSRGQTLRRSLISYRQRNMEGERSLITFIEPVDVRNTRYLNWTYEDPDQQDDLWIFLPSENLTRRISGTGGKTGSFMRSDFSNEDIEKRFLDDDQQRLLRSEVVFDQDAYVVEFVPVSKHDSNYSKREIWVNKQTWLPVQIYYFDKSGQHFKTAIHGGVQKINSIWTVTKIMMETPRRQSKTLLQYSDITYNTDLPDTLFTHAALRR